MNSQNDLAAAGASARWYDESRLARRRLHIRRRGPGYTHSPVRVNPLPCLGAPLYLNRNS